MFECVTIFNTNIHMLRVHNRSKYISRLFAVLSRYSGLIDVIFSSFIFIFIFFSLRINV